MRVTKRLVDLVLTACESDAVVATQFFRVTGLLDPPVRMLRPSFLSRVATVNLGLRKHHLRPTTSIYYRSHSHVDLLKGHSGTAYYR
jgi:hypothetical protein